MRVSNEREARARAQLPIHYMVELLSTRSLVKNEIYLIDYALSLSLSLCTIQRLKCRVSIHLYISFFYLFVIVHSLVSNWLERHESHAHDGSFRFWTGGMVHGAQLTDKQPLRPENVKIEPARACTHIQMSNAAQWKLVMHTEKRTYPNEWPGEWHRTKIVKSQIVSNRNWLNFLICSLSPPPYVDFSLMLHMEK